nr:hypothetical protein [Enterobacter hormaechei]
MDSVGSFKADYKRLKVRD